MTTMYQQVNTNCSFNTAKNDLPHGFIKVKFEYTYLLIWSITPKMFQVLFSVRNSGKMPIKSSNDA